MCRDQIGGGLIARYRNRLPVDDMTPVVSLGEGSTPLIELVNLPEVTARGIRLYVKYEGLNPTGSFKDRGMTMAVSKALEEGARAIICASTGNTSASATAYAARAGMAAFVLVPDGKIAFGKLAQAIIGGAIVIQITGDFDDGMRLVKAVAADAPVTIVNSINPFRLQGQKTAAFEIVEALGMAPDFHCLPVGNAGNISAYWIGYSECAASDGASLTAACLWCEGQCPFISSNPTTARPKMVGYQASGAAPFIRGSMVDQVETVATAIRIGHPQSWDQAWAACHESGGWFDALDDDEILAAQKQLAAREGIFCEPASAASLAGALRDIKDGKIPAGSAVVCTLTGHGLKDPDTAIAQNHRPIIKINANHADVKRAIFDNM